MKRVDDIQAVKALVRSYIEGTKASDPDLLRSLFHDSAIMSGYLGDDLLVGSPEPFFQAISERKVQPNYTADITEIAVTGRTATATVVEDNIYDLSFVSTFHLINIDGGWTITSKLFHHD